MSGKADPGLLPVGWRLCADSGHYAALDETAPFELVDYRWIGEACSTDLTFNRSEKISTWLTSSNGT